MARTINTTADTMFTNLSAAADAAKEQSGQKEKIEVKEGLYLMKVHSYSPEVTMAGDKKWLVGTTIVAPLDKETLDYTDDRLECADARISMHYVYGSKKPDTARIAQENIALLMRSCGVDLTLITSNKTFNIEMMELAEVEERYVAYVKPSKDGKYNNVYVDEDATNKFIAAEDGNKSEAVAAFVGANTDSSVVDAILDEPEFEQELVQEEAAVVAEVVEASQPLSRRRAGTMSK